MGRTLDLYNQRGKSFLQQSRCGPESDSLDSKTLGRTLARDVTESPIKMSSVRSTAKRFTIPKAKSRSDLGTYNLDRDQKGDFIPMGLAMDKSPICYKTMQSTQPRYGTLADISTRNNAVEYVMVAAAQKKSYIHTPLLDNILDGVYNTDTAHKMMVGTKMVKGVGTKHPGMTSATQRIGLSGDGGQCEPHLGPGTYDADGAFDNTKSNPTAHGFPTAVDIEKVNSIGPGTYDVGTALDYTGRHPPNFSISSTERNCDLAKKEFHHKLPMSRGPWSDIEEWDKSVYLEPSLPRIPAMAKQGPFANKRDESLGQNAEQEGVLQQGMYNSAMRGPKSYKSSFDTKQSHDQFPYKVVPEIFETASTQRSHLGPGAYSINTSCLENPEPNRKSAVFGTVPRVKWHIQAIGSNYRTMRPRWEMSPAVAEEADLKANLHMTAPIRHDTAAVRTWSKNRRKKPQINLGQWKEGDRPRSAWASPKAMK